MKRLLKRILFIILMSFVPWLQAHTQEGNPLQHIPGLSQSLWTNPSFQNKTEKLVVGLPLASGAWIDWNANFSLDYIFSKNFTYSFDNFYKELGERGQELGTIQIPILYLSLRQGNQNFTFVISERIYTESSFDHEFLKFIDYGLEPYYGRNEAFGPMNIHAYHYRELSFAYSKQLWEGLTIGFRPKMLFGRMNYDMRNMSIHVLTDSDSGELQVKPEGTYQVAGQLEIISDEVNQVTSIRPNLSFSDYFFNLRNLGAAIDLGFNYKNGKTEIAAAVNDLGFFIMNQSVYDVTYTGTLRYNSTTLYQSNNPDGENYKEPKYALQDLINSNPYLISVSQSEENLTEYIPIKANISARQQISNTLDLGVSAQFTFHGTNMKTYLSAFGYKALNDRFDLTSSITLLDFKKLLPGAGVCYTAKNTQVYFATNNITALFWPSSAKYLNLCLGVNFLFSTE